MNKFLRLPSAGTCVAVLGGLRILDWFLHCFLPFDQPHRWRQIDTMAVAVRYWLRWTQETSLQYPLLPAILDSADSYGITSMEFPLLSLVLAPIFVFGPFWGQVLAKFLLAGINVALTLVCAYLWRGKTLGSVPMDAAFIALTMTTLSAQYIFRFMPDYPSMLLVCLAISGAWQRQWAARALLAASIGLLIKPTSMIVFALCFLHPDSGAFLRRNLWWMGAAFGFAVLYYVGAVPWIDGINPATYSAFRVHPQNPLANLRAFVLEPFDVITLFSRKLIFAPGLFSLLLIFPLIDSPYRRRLVKLLFLLLLQVLCIAALDGVHSFIHEYYFIGCAPLLILILGESFLALKDSAFFRSRKALTMVLLTSCVVTYLEQIQFDLRTVLPIFGDRYVWANDCEALKARHPEFPWRQGFVFRSNVQPFPEIGLCFLERVNSETASYGIFSTHEGVPGGCRVIDSQNAAVLARCG